MTPPTAILTTRRTRRSERPATARSRFFPSPSPVTAEETILLRFAQQHPEQAREVLRPPPSGPLQIDPVVIAPIQIADLSGSRPASH